MTATVQTPCWIRPDGTRLEAPEGLDAPLRSEGDDPSDPARALALGWIGLRPLGDDAWWEVLQPTGAPTVRAQKAAGALARRRDAPTPKPLAASLLRLARCAWDSDRYPNPEAALAVRRQGVLSDRLHDAIANALARAGEGHLTPDLERIEAAHAILLREVSGMYETAHAWRYGPALTRPADGRWSEDAAERRSGAAAAAELILAGAVRMQGALAEARLAALGLAPGDVPEPVPVEPVPGEPPLEALTRIALEREEELDRIMAEKIDRPALTDALREPLRPSARIWVDALSGTGFQVSHLRAYAETYLCRSSRPDAALERAHDDLASHLISHECGRTALELRDRIRRVMPIYLERLREAVSAVPTEGARP